MDILFFAQISPYLKERVGGAETSMRLIAESLAARGHRVSFASLRPDMLPFVSRMRRKGLEVLLLPNPHRSPARRLLLKAGRTGAARALEGRGWDRVDRLLFGRGRTGRRPNLLYAFYEIEFLRRALRRRDAAGTGPRMAIVMRMAGLSWYEAIRQGGDKAAIAAVFNGVDAINFLSEPSRALVAARAAEVGMPIRPRASLVADIGVDVRGVPLTWAGPSPGAGLRLLVATRFSPQQKRQDLLIEALGLVRDRLDLRVTMIGNGPTREPLTRRRDELGLSDTVEILPFLPQEDVWARMRQADLLCHPCDYEGLGKIILESMMLGLPVLVSDVPPLDAYVLEGETGFRVANTPEAWADKLAALAADKARLPGVSARARAFVEANYDVGRNIDLYEAQFESLLSVAATGSGAGAQ
jgi:glycosyltransferase involved in cell wall biosynthesis